MNGTEETRKRIEAALEGLEASPFDGPDGIPGVEVARDSLLEVLGRLKAAGEFESLTFVTGVDHMMSRQGREPEPRFEVNHQLYSLAHKDRVRVKVRLRTDDLSVGTCTGLWPGAGYMERECYDMFGVQFEGHTNLKRLLMPDGYGHHPLRKEFPHKGIEPDRLYREWDRERRLAEKAALEGEG